MRSHQSCMKAFQICVVFSSFQRRPKTCFVPFRFKLNTFASLLKTNLNCQSGLSIIAKTFLWHFFKPLWHRLCMHFMAHHRWAVTRRQGDSWSIAVRKSYEKMCCYFFLVLLAPKIYFNDCEFDEQTVWFTMWMLWWIISVSASFDFKYGPEIK